MGRDGRTPLKHIIGPDGAPLTAHDLPPANLKRWVSRRKAEVVLAVEGGLLSLSEACRRYNLTVEEFLNWERALEQHGVEGLKLRHAREARHDRRH